jgi:heme exporter protein C
VTTAVKVQLGLAAAMFAAAPWIIDAAPYEATMGLVYKIYFFHMPSAWMFLVAAIVAGVASARFLFAKLQASDATAVAAAELAVLFGLLALVTGPLWARKAWGVWWVWDARLTSSLMTFLIFVAYLILRRFGGPGSEKLAAGLAVFGMANVPFIYVSVNYWRTLHPKTSVVPTLPVEMGRPLWFCVVAFLLLFLALLSLRARLERQRWRIDALYLA